MLTPISWANTTCGVVEARWTMAVLRLARVLIPSRFRPGHERGWLEMGAGVLAGEQPLLVGQNARGPERLGDRKRRHEGLPAASDYI